MQWLLFTFGYYGCGYVIALVFLALASFSRRWLRVVLCVVSWLIVIVQGWWIFTIMNLASLGREHVRRDDHTFEIAGIAGITLSVVVTASWSYRLLRKSKFNHAPASFQTRNDNAVSYEGSNGKD